jgi:cellulose synthase/poly-beta-1,6-N-acetylglucosamine synthase-like glycosyltransferase
VSTLQRKLALIIPAHNEELVIEATINSALDAGQQKRDIFVASDNSTDQTVAIATRLLGEENVLDGERRGKAGTVKAAIERFDIINHYQWMHVADADSIFGVGYFDTFRNALDPNKYVASTGYVQSLPGGWISKFRVYEYTFGFGLLRRIQAVLGIVTVIPGPTSCLRTDILSKLDFETGSLTEDFDITMQIHRQKLGKIQYIPAAKTYTQDPNTLSDYRNQVARWYRGFFQGILSHRVGTQFSKIDIYIWLVILQSLVYGAEILIWLPFMIGLTHALTALSVFFLSEITMYFMVSLACAIAAKRMDILAAFPFFYFMRLLNLYIFYTAFIEVVFLRRFQNNSVGWSTAGRRYAITATAESVN